MNKLLDQIEYPVDLRRLKKDQLENVSKELRGELISTVSETGGHLGAGLGVVELTVAIHYVFNTPKDKLVWDVGHQCYPHKIITGRKNSIRTLRKGGGLSGFTKRTESDYDPFGAAHSSTSISSTLGMAVANKLSNNKPKKLRRKKTLRRTYKVGRSSVAPKVSVLVSNKTLRNRVSTQKQLLKQTPIQDVKKYLIKHGLIRIGSITPNDVLRKMYESMSLVCGEIHNHNPDTLLYNYINGNE